MEFSFVDSTLELAFFNDGDTGYGLVDNFVGG